MKHRYWGPGFATILALACATHAAPFPASALLQIGYHEIVIADLDPAVARLRARRGDLAVSADLTGEGTSDEARLFRSPEGKLLVMIAAMGPDQLDTFVLAAPDGTADRLGLRLLPGGTRYRAQAGAIRTTDRPTLAAFAYGGSANVYEYTGGEFEVVVTNDQAVTRPALGSEPA